MTYLLEWAWQLHENNWEDELVDSTLSEFNEEEAKRIIKIGLLCTHSITVATTIHARSSGNAFRRYGCGYLTDWKFDDLTSGTSVTELDDASTVTDLVTDTTNKGTDFSFNNSSASTSIMGESPPNAIHSMIQNDVDGR